MLHLYVKWTLVALATMLIFHSTYAQTTCAAEANFQGCKTIQETKLNGCPPADYACMCAAHKLIQECYNLCPSYAADASAHDGTVKSICNAVPSTSSSVILPTASSVRPSIAATHSAQPSQQVQQTNQQHSAATTIVPTLFALVSLVTLCAFQS